MVECMWLNQNYHEVLMLIQIMPNHSMPDQMSYIDAMMQPGERALLLPRSQSIAWQSLCGSLDRTCA